MSKEASIVNATTKTGARRQYIATIQAQKNGLGDSFSVYIFIGSFDEKESSHWRFEPNFVGTHGFFANPGFINYGTPLTGSGTVPLTNALVSRVEKGELTGLGPNEVSIYLKRNLKWRIMKVRHFDIMCTAKCAIHLRTRSGRWLRRSCGRRSWA